MGYIHTITALDLCAAGLGRTFCQNQKDHEFDLADFDPDPGAKQAPKRAQRRALLPTPACDWVLEACNDPRYGIIKQARDSLTHARLPRIVSLGGSRLELRLGATTFGVREILETARDYAADHVSAFFKVLPLA